jgi:hypothetical protein
MTTYYLDTSAAVKLYVQEIGSGWLKELLVTPRPPVVVTSHLLRVEMWSAFARRLREHLVFLCADDRLLQAAAAEGLATDNPNSHL